MYMYAMSLSLETIKATGHHKSMKTQVWKRCWTTQLRASNGNHFIRNPSNISTLYN